MTLPPADRAGQLDPVVTGQGKPQLPFSVLAKPTGAVCNLDCAYCFFLPKQALYGTGPQEMSEAALQTYLTNLLQSQPDGPVSIGWQGGEPTMRGLPFFRRAVVLAAQLARPGQQISHTLQTNGTLLDDAWGAFLAEHRFLVGLSIDGPAHLHDAYRVNHVGRGSHAQVVRGWQVLARHKVDTNILCTVHAVNQGHPLEVYRYFRDELGARHLQFIPIVERAAKAQLALAEAGWRGLDGRPVLSVQQGDAVTTRSVDPVAWGEFMIAIFDEWARHDIGEVFIQHFEATLGALFGQYSLCVLAPECGASLVVDQIGDVYACDHYVEPDYHLGNIADRSLQDMLTSPAQRQFGRTKRTSLPRQCRVCPVRWACNGGCPKDRFATCDDGEPGLNYLCRGDRNFFTHAQPTLERVADLLRAGQPAKAIMIPSA